MAKAEVKLLEELLIRLSKLGEKTDEAAAKALEAGGKVVLDKVRQNLESVIGQDTKTTSRSTGELLNALGLSPAMLDRNGKHGQPPKPFMKPAQSASKQECIDAVKQVLEKELSEL